MIVEGKKAETPSLESNLFNQHLDSLENALHKMERYSLKLKEQIGDIKKRMTTNRRVINRLKENEQRMMILLEDSLDKEEEPGKKVVRLGDVVHKDQKLFESPRHLRRTCKVTNIREICWTHCESSTNGGLTNIMQQEKPCRKEKMVLPSLEKDLHRERGGQMRQLSFDANEYLALINKVNLIGKMIKHLGMKRNTIIKVKQVCKHALTAILERESDLSWEILNSGKHRTRSEPKDVKPKFGNPYL